ncbi:hypothetical protein [Glycomyces harbinensis]|uniref:Beta/Gamma crystallin n=1 Tax=Glycomyces harbinensis TaxID=58114 RepID=A0A1G6ZR41_9ACTN|nr:hypothetical protein [Glycomyces harbinensis]SDE04036.1 hypothetical protein SAMN05216270_111106 [Glycomyces harbinensis]
MRLTTRLGIATAAACAAALFAGTPAQAATGDLVLRRQGIDTVITDPGAGCMNVSQGFSEVVNHTDTWVTVYSGFGCAGFGRVVDSGSTSQVGDARSVRIPS